MASSSVLTYAEPDQMEAAHAAARAIEVMPTAREPLTWRVTRVELDNLWLVRAQESGPRIRYIELDPERTFISFLMRPGTDVFVRGELRLPNSLIRHARGQALYERTSGPTEWAALSIRTSELVDASSALAGRDLSAPRDPQVVMPAPGDMANLLRAQTIASDLAKNSPQLLTHPEVARAHLVRRALLAAETGATVTEVTARFGFWHLGRFSAGYHAIFGELPSTTLARRLR